MAEKEKNGKHEFSDFDLGTPPPKKPYARPAKRDTEAVEIISDSDAITNSGKLLPNEDKAFRIPLKSEGLTHSPKSIPVRTWSSPAYAPRKPVPHKASSSSKSVNIHTSRYSGHGAAFARPQPKHLESTSPSSTSDGPQKVPENALPENSSDILIEYQRTGTIQKIKIKRWNGGYGFYEKFVKDAIVSYSTEPPSAPVDRVPYFSYIPKYSSLTSSQWSYYLYFRKMAEEGRVLPETDFSYVMLYIYEIINLSGVIAPAEGASRLGKLWSMYRGIHPSIDKYMAEWMADYCLIYGISLPKSVYSFIADAARRSTIKEFYLDAALDTKESLHYAAEIILEALSDYNGSKSRCASEIENFRDKLMSHVIRVITEMKTREIGFFSPAGQREIELKRDAFCGSLCACSIKRRIELLLRTPLRSPGNRRIMTDIVKGCENVLRKECGIRSRLAVPSIKNGELKDLFSYLFNDSISNDGTARGSTRYGGKQANQEDYAANAEYLKLYDMPNEPLTAERAAEIEAKSWQNTALLTDELFECSIESRMKGLSGCGETEADKNTYKQLEGKLSTKDIHCKNNPEYISADKTDADDIINNLEQTANTFSKSFSSPKEPYRTNSYDFNIEITKADGASYFSKQLKAAEPKLYEILCSAAKKAKGEGGASFSEECRKAGIFADDGAARINDLAAELLGDILLELHGSEYNVIEDYLDEILG